jgi:hypothetical protein
MLVGPMYRVRGGWFVATDLSRSQDGEFPTGNDCRFATLPARQYISPIPPLLAACRLEFTEHFSDQGCDVVISIPQEPFSNSHSSAPGLVTGFQIFT